jgi:hypothetical protein
MIISTSSHNFHMIFDGFDVGSVANGGSDTKFVQSHQILNVLLSGVSVMMGPSKEGPEFGH